MKKTLVSLFAALALAGCSEVTAVMNGEVPLDSARIEAQIEDEVSAQIGGPVTVECPDPLSAEVGQTRQCVIEDSYGTTALVDITVQNSDGYITWEVRE